MRRFIDFYGAHPLHLLVLLACFALAGYAVLQVARDPSAWLILIWFAAAVIAHDLVLFPLYALADRSAGTVLHRTPLRGVPVLNHVRVPVLGAGLTFLLFLPGIVRQGGATHLAATGLDQQPYLGRWLLLVAAMFGVSAVVYAVRIRRAPRRSPHREEQRGRRGEGEQRRPGRPVAGPGQGASGHEQPDLERQPDPLDLGLAHRTGHRGPPDG